MRDRPAYEIGDIRVDLGRMAAVRGETAIPLEPKAFDVLVHLIEQRHRVVTKDELLDSVWKGTFVTPNVLTRAVAQIRKALGDETDRARYIETVAKRGYRFIAPVTVTVAARGSSLAVPSPAAAVEPSRDPAERPFGPGSARRSYLPAMLLLLVAAGAIFAIIRVMGDRTAARDAPTADLHLKRLTNRRGYSGAPALSPDGRAIVYASDATGGVELYRTSLLQGGGEVALTKTGGYNIQPAWSPDGQWIAFHDRVKGGVWIVPASGGVPQQIAEFGSDPAWSPDSQTIVFTSDAGGLASQSSLWTVRRDGTDRRTLTRVGAPAGGHRSPAWSHDGRHVAFAVANGGWKIQIWTVDVVSGSQHLIDTSTIAQDPVFAPGDRALLWGGRTVTGNGRLFIHAIDAEGAPVGATDVVLPMDGSAIDGLSIAADGTLAFAAGVLDANLWAIDLAPDGRGREPVRLTDDVSRNTHPDYSSDGRIAYMQAAVGSSPSAWIASDDGSGRMALLPGTGAGNPQWDGNRRLLLALFPEGAVTPHEFAWLDAASRRLSPSGLQVADMASPRLSPDGTELAFHRIEKDGSISVWVTRFDGTRTRIAADPEAISYPEWSPDGQAFAVEIKRGDSTQVGVVARAGGPIELLTNVRGQSWPHSWAPDNDRIAFAGERSGVWNVYSVSRRSRVVTQLTAFTSASGYVRYPAWSPNGKRIVFERAMETADVWTMTLPSGAGKQ